MSSNHNSSNIEFYALIMKDSFAMGQIKRGKMMVMMMVVMEAMKLRLMFEVGCPQRHVGRRSHDELSV